MLLSDLYVKIEVDHGRRKGLKELEHGCDNKGQSPSTLHKIMNSIQYTCTLFTRKGTKRESLSLHLVVSIVDKEQPPVTEKGRQRRKTETLTKDKTWAVVTLLLTSLHKFPL